MTHRISVVRPADIANDAALSATWRSIRAQNAELQSPFYAPEFVALAGFVRNDARVAVIEDASGRVAGFLPFQPSTSKGVIEPIAAPLSDHHGLIASSSFAVDVDWTALLRALHADAFRFDHLAPSQVPSGAHAVRIVDSPGIDVTGGWQATRDRRKARGSRQLDDIERKARKLAREVGPLRFEAHTDAPAILDVVLRWKSAQCLASGATDFFAWAWTRDLARRVASTRTSSSPGAFEGALSVLYAGDAVVAAHLGMHDANVWHWWFPVYDHEHARYSPGAILLVRLAETAADAGATLVDFGKGDEEYKVRLADAHHDIAEGLVGVPSLSTSVRGAALTAASKLRRSPSLQPLRPFLRSLRAMRDTLLLQR